ncbi:MAG: metal-dependent transcriptional regulator [Euryarchaeota archaeon]|nr:metal-dependent transcriptional regulator [Euryarchaeota archaeon]
MPKEHIEEYIEAIYDIAGRDGIAKTTEVAEHLHNAPASVTEAFQRMKQKGLVRYESHKGASLTAKGFKTAMKMKRKHRLLEIISITSLKPGQKGKIAFIQGGKGVIQRLCDLGLTNKTSISILRSAPLNGPIEICVRGCKIVIGRDIANKIFVHAEG